MLKRSLCAFLAVVIFAVDGPGAYAAESAFWAERRRSSEKSRSSADGPIASASLPSSSDPGAVFRQLPALSTLSESLRRDLPADLPPALTTLLNALPPAYGQVRRVTLPRGPLRGIVLHIQDVHRNAEAQRNISRVLQEVMGRGQAGVVGLEGAFEPLPLEGYRLFPDRGAVTLAADHLLRENWISGPVHAGMTLSAPAVAPPFLGIDDPAQYAANVSAYRRSTSLAPLFKGKIAAALRDVAARKAAVFNPALKSFDDEVQKYRRGEAKLGDHVRFLAGTPARAGLPSSIGTFLQALDMESTLDFAKAETDRARLIAALVRALDKASLDGLVSQSLLYKSGLLGHSGYYRTLKDLCRKNGVDLARFAAFDGYVRYVLLSDAVDAETLLKDVRSLEDAGYGGLAGTTAERSLIAEDRALHLSSRLVDFSLSPGEWSEYASTGLPSPAGLSMGSFEDFYRAADARDRLMSDNVLKALKGRAMSTAVLVTGGFHAPGIERRLREAGLALVSFVPRVDKVEDAGGTAYLSAFTREKTPLEKLFAGQKLFLASEPASDDVLRARAPGEVIAAATAESESGAVDPDADYKAMTGRRPEEAHLSFVARHTGPHQALVVIKNVLTSAAEDLKAVVRDNQLNIEEAPLQIAAGVGLFLLTEWLAQHAQIAGVPGLLMSFAPASLQILGPVLFLAAVATGLFDGRGKVLVGKWSLEADKAIDDLLRRHGVDASPLVDDLWFRIDDRMTKERTPPSVRSAVSDYFRTAWAAKFLAAAELEKAGVPTFAEWKSLIDELIDGAAALPGDPPRDLGIKLHARLEEALRDKKAPATLEAEVLSAFEADWQVVFPPSSKNNGWIQDWLRDMDVLPWFKKTVADMLWKADRPLDASGWFFLSPIPLRKIQGAISSGLDKGDREVLNGAAGVDVHQTLLSHASARWALLEETTAWEAGPEERRKVFEHRQSIIRRLKSQRMGEEALAEAADRLGKTWYPDGRMPSDDKRISLQILRRLSGVTPAPVFDQFVSFLEKNPGFDRKENRLTQVLVLWGEILDPTIPSIDSLSPEARAVTKMDLDVFRRAVLTGRTGSLEVSEARRALAYVWAEAYEDLPPQNRAGSLEDLLPRAFEGLPLPAVNPFDHPLLHAWMERDFGGPASDQPGLVAAVDSLEPGDFPDVGAADWKTRSLAFFPVLTGIALSISGFFHLESPRQARFLAEGFSGAELSSFIGTGPVLFLAAFGALGLWRRIVRPSAVYNSLVWNSHGALGIETLSSNPLSDFHRRISARLEKPDFLGEKIFMVRQKARKDLPPFFAGTSLRILWKTVYLVDSYFVDKLLTAPNLKDSDVRRMERGLSHYLRLISADANQSGSQVSKEDLIKIHEKVFRAMAAEAHWKPFTRWMVTVGIAPPLEEAPKTPVPVAPILPPRFTGISEGVLVFRENGVDVRIPLPSGKGDEGPVVQQILSRFPLLSADQVERVKRAVQNHFTSSVVSAVGGKLLGFGGVDLYLLFLRLAEGNHPAASLLLAPLTAVSFLGVLAFRGRPTRIIALAPPLQGSRALSEPISSGTSSLAADLPEAWKIEADRVIRGILGETNGVPSAQLASRAQNAEEALLARAEVSGSVSSRRAAMDYFEKALMKALHPAAETANEVSGVRRSPSAAARVPAGITEEEAEAIYDRLRRSWSVGAVKDDGFNSLFYEVEARQSAFPLIMKLAASMPEAAFAQFLSYLESLSAAERRGGRLLRVLALWTEMAVPALPDLAGPAARKARTLTETHLTLLRAAALGAVPEEAVEASRREVRGAWLLARQEASSGSKDMAVFILAERMAGAFERLDVFPPVDDFRFHELRAWVEGAGFRAPLNPAYLAGEFRRGGIAALYRSLFEAARPAPVPSNSVDESVLYQIPLAADASLAREIQTRGAKAAALRRETEDGGKETTPEEMRHFLGAAFASHGPALLAEGRTAAKPEPSVVISPDALIPPAEIVPSYKKPVLPFHRRLLVRLGLVKRQVLLPLSPEEAGTLADVLQEVWRAGVPLVPEERRSTVDALVRLSAKMDLPVFQEFMTHIGLYGRTSNPVPLPAAVTAWDEVLHLGLSRAALPLGPESLQQAWRKAQKKTALFLRDEASLRLLGTTQGEETTRDDHREAWQEVLDLVPRDVYALRAFATAVRDAFDDDRWSSPFTFVDRIAFPDLEAWLKKFLPQLDISPESMPLNTPWLRTVRRAPVASGDRETPVHGFRPVSATAPAARERDFSFQPGSAKPLGGDDLSPREKKIQLTEMVKAGREILRASPELLGAATAALAGFMRANPPEDSFMGRSWPKFDGHMNAVLRMLGLLRENHHKKVAFFILPEPLRAADGRPIEATSLMHKGVLTIFATKESYADPVRHTGLLHEVYENLLLSPSPVYRANAHRIATMMESYFAGPNAYAGARALEDLKRMDIVALNAFIGDLVEAHDRNQEAFKDQEALREVAFAHIEFLHDEALQEFNRRPQAEMDVLQAAAFAAGQKTPGPVPGTVEEPPSAPVSSTIEEALLSAVGGAPSEGVSSTEASDPDIMPGPFTIERPSGTIRRAERLYEPSESQEVVRIRTAAFVAAASSGSPTEEKPDDRRTPVFKIEGGRLLDLTRPGVRLPAEKKGPDPSADEPRFFPAEDLAPEKGKKEEESTNPSSRISSVIAFLDQAAAVATKLKELPSKQEKSLGHFLESLPAQFEKSPDEKSRTRLLIDVHRKLFESAGEAKVSGEDVQALRNLAEGYLGQMGIEVRTPQVGDDFDDEEMEAVGKKGRFVARVLSPAYRWKEDYDRPEPLARVELSNKRISRPFIGAAGVFPEMLALVLQLLRSFVVSVWQAINLFIHGLEPTLAAGRSFFAAYPAYVLVPAGILVLDVAFYVFGRRFPKPDSTHAYRFDSRKEGFPLVKGRQVPQRYAQALKTFRKELDRPLYPIFLPNDNPLPRGIVVGEFRPSINGYFFDLRVLARILDNDGLNDREKKAAVRALARLLKDMKPARFFNGRETIEMARDRALKKTRDFQPGLAALLGGMPFLSAANQAKPAALTPRAFPALPPPAAGTPPAGNPSAGESRSLTPSAPTAISSLKGQSSSRREATPLSPRQRFTFEGGYNRVFFRGFELFIREDGEEWQAFPIPRTIDHEGRELVEFLDKTLPLIKGDQPQVKLWIEKVLAGYYGLDFDEMFKRVTERKNTASGKGETVFVDVEALRANHATPAGGIPAAGAPAAGNPGQAGTDAVSMSPGGKIMMIGKNSLRFIDWNIEDIVLSNDPSLVMGSVLVVFNSLGRRDQLWLKDLLTGIYGANRFLDDLKVAPEGSSPTSAPPDSRRVVPPNNLNDLVSLGVAAFFFSALAKTEGVGRALLLFLPPALAAGAILAVAAAGFVVIRDAVAAFRDARALGPSLPAGSPVSPEAQSLVDEVFPHAASRDVGSLGAKMSGDAKALLTAGRAAEEIGNSAVYRRIFFAFSPLRSSAEVERFATDRAAALLLAGKGPGGEFVMEASSLFSPAGDPALVSLVGALARRTEIDRIVLEVRDRSVTPLSDAQVAVLFPEAGGKVKVLWAKTDGRLESEEMDARGVHKLSAAGTRKALELPPAAFLSIHAEDESLVAKDDPAAEVLADLGAVLHVLRNIWQSFQEEQAAEKMA